MVTIGAIKLRFIKGEIKVTLTRPACKGDPVKDVLLEIKATLRG